MSDRLPGAPGAPDQPWRDKYLVFGAPTLGAAERAEKAARERGEREEREESGEHRTCPAKVFKKQNCGCFGFDR